MQRNRWRSRAGLALLTVSTGFTVGCAGMADLADELSAFHNIRVIDGVAAAVARKFRRRSPDWRRNFTAHPSGCLTRAFSIKSQCNNN